MRKSDLIKHLARLGEEELRNEILNLYGRFSDVQAFYTMELGSASQRQKVYAKAKKEISSKFVSRSSRRPRRPRIQKVHKIIREVEKQSVFPFEMIEVYLHVVEEAIQFARRYRFESKPLHNTIKTYFKKAIELVHLNQLEETHSDRCFRLYHLTETNPSLQEEIKPLLGRLVLGADK